ncbi:hypothetical protein ASE63_17920 [Bosea sp. Root381]|nr:hypothetical protein ASE63_17920 [Bosea sp. Root381]
MRGLGPAEDHHASDNVPPSDEVLVTLSLAELLELVELVIKPTTFGEALREIGFKPAKGARLAPREPHPMRRGPLPRSPKDD